MSELRQRISRLWTYASTQISTANGDRRNQERSGLMSALWGQYSSAVAWMDPEVQALGADKVAAFIAADAGLTRQAKPLRDTLRNAPHTLSPQTESALAALGPVTGAFSGVRELLVTADIPWPTVHVDGKPVLVSDTGYGRLRQHPDRAMRK